MKEKKIQNSIQNWQKKIIINFPNESTIEINNNNNNVFVIVMEQKQGKEKKNLGPKKLQTEFLDLHFFLIVQLVHIISYQLLCHPNTIIILKSQIFLIKKSCHHVKVIIIICLGLSILQTPFPIFY